MRWFKRLYGSNPLHLLVSIACLAVAAYAALLLAKGGDVKGIIIWFAVAIIGHDLILFPLYAVADRSIRGVLTHRPPALPKVQWINHLRVPVVISAILFGMWWPLMFNVPKEYTEKTDLPTSPYLGHWLMVTAALFLLSALAFAVKLAVGGGRGGNSRGGGGRGGGGRGGGSRRMPAEDPLSSLSAPRSTGAFGTAPTGGFGTASTGGFGTAPTGGFRASSTGGFGTAPTGEWQSDPRLR
jgi:hypothetical protein